MWRSRAAGRAGRGLAGESPPVTSRPRSQAASSGLQQAPASACPGRRHSAQAAPEQREARQPGSGLGVGRGAELGHHLVLLPGGPALSGSGEVNPRARPESAFRRADSVGFSLHLRVKITQLPSVLETRLAPAARTCVWAPCTAAGAADAESGGCSARGVWTRGTGAGAVRGQAQPDGGPGQPAPQHSTPSARGRRRPASAVPAPRARSDQAPTSKPAGGSCEAAKGRSVALTRVSGCPTATEPAKREAQRPRLCCRPRLPEPRDARASARVLQKRVSMRTASRVSVRVVPTATVQRKPHVLFGHQSPTFVLRGASFIRARTWGSARARLWFRTPAPGA